MDLEQMAASLSQLLLLMEKLRARQEALERLAEAMLISLPTHQARALVRQAHDRFAIAREQAPLDRHPDADASALQLLAALGAAAGG